MNQISFDLDLKEPKNSEALEKEEVSKPCNEEPRVYTISDLNHYVRHLLEGEFPDIWVRGEISNFKAHSSGHFYFSLKDENSQINAVMFKGFNSKLKFRPQTGMEVLTRGKITVYEPRGSYQLFCQVMEPVGVGALQQAFNQLKEKLDKEGLFARELKKALPIFPRHVALVTSPTGAAVHDMLNVLKGRLKGLKITLVPVLVQGEGAPSSLIEGLRRAQLIPGVDVIIVGRGGGSMEDLWAFNDEGVARSIFKSHIPVISAVGHEVDFTIADFVADRRAPTPSVAAELVVQGVSEFNEKLAHLKARLYRSWQQAMASKRNHLHYLRQRLVDPQRRLEDLTLRCDEWVSRLESSMKRSLESCHTQVNHLQSLMDSLNPLKVLERGYAVVKMEKALIHKYKDLKIGDRVQIQLGEGGFWAQVVQTNKGGPYGF